MTARLTFMNSRDVTPSCSIGSTRSAYMEEPSELTVPRLTIASIPTTTMKAIRMAEVPSNLARTLRRMADTL